MKIEPEKISGTLFTWHHHKTDEQQFVAECEETGKRFHVASRAQLGAKIHDYEQYMKDVIVAIHNIDKLRPKLEKYLGPKH